MSTCAPCTEPCTNCKTNLDISGIGVKVVLYILGFCMVFTPPNPNALGRSLSELIWAPAATSGLALLVTALVQLARCQLSLYHAIIVIHLLYFTGLVIILPGHSTRRDDFEGFVRNTGLMILLCGSWALFNAFGLYVWANLENFGCFPSDNSNIRYPVFLSLVPILKYSWFRTGWMVLHALNFGVLAVFLLGLRFTLPQPSKLVPPLLLALVGRFSKLLVLVYAIVTLEAYEKYNKTYNQYDQQSWPWTYGQIIALTHTAYEIVCFLIGNVPWLESEMRKIWEKGAYDEGISFTSASTTSFVPTWNLPLRDRTLARRQDSPR